MALPASGPISMSQFNTSLDWTGTSRAFNEPNSSLSTLFSLGSQPEPNNFDLDQNLPNAMSEWYGYIPCTQTPGSDTGLTDCVSDVLYPIKYNCDGSTYTDLGSPLGPCI